MKAIVHIGMPKTGSTSIQEFLQINRQTLAKQGFRYQRHFEARMSQMEFAAAALSEIGAVVPNKYSQMRYGFPNLSVQKKVSADLLMEVGKGVKEWAEPVFIISSEHLQQWLVRPAQISALHRMLRRYFEDVRYVVYLRNQTDLAPSAYSEALRHGAIGTLDQFVRHHADARSNAFDHHAMVSRWAEAVGRKNLDVRLFDRDFLHNRDLI